jgi:hypothetical protein
MRKVPLSKLAGVLFATKKLSLTTKLSDIAVRES